MTERGETFAVMGLGQVGLRLAVALGARYRTLGIDVSKDRAALLSQGIDRVEAVPSATLKAAKLLSFSSEVTAVQDADLVFVTVPTAVHPAGQPDLSELTNCCEQIAGHLKPGAIIVVESTVYPGATEDLCIPALEKVSGKLWKKDFFVAYSPERINPGDQEHQLPNIRKVVAADCVDTLERVARVYESIIPAGVHRVSSIKAAETTKLIENVQRDVNIALVNELSMICHKNGVDTAEVLAAAATKWNFVSYQPGLVGGPCLGLASHFLARGYGPGDEAASLMQTGRQLNEGMSAFVVQELLHQCSDLHRPGSLPQVLVLGLSFKANISSTKNSKVLELVSALGATGCDVTSHDPLADAGLDQSAFPRRPVTWDSLPQVSDALILAVAHDFYQTQSLEKLCSLVRPGGLVMDLTGTLDAVGIARLGRRFWRF